MEEEDTGRKQRKRGQGVPPGGGGGDGVPAAAAADLISRLPDELLGCVITLLPTKDGARTQILSSRWRPLWRFSPLNLDADFVGSFGDVRDDEGLAARLRRLLSAHEAPVRRFSLKCLGRYGLPHVVERFLQSPRLQDAQEFELEFYYLTGELPPCVFRFSPALRVLYLSSSCTKLPALTTPTLCFPSLKQLVLLDLIISERALHGVLSRCPVLETLLLDGISGARRVRISSLTLRTVSVSDCRYGQEKMLEELVIVNAPLLERLIQCVRVIRIIRAPRLRTLAYDDDTPILQLETIRFEKIVLVGPSGGMLRSVKILGLITAPNIDFVTGLLKCFPCVEKLYIVVDTQIIFKNDVKCSAPLECLDRHLKKVQIMNYDEKRLDVNFIKFFVLNARVLESMKFVVRRDECGTKWIARQHKKLQVNDRASEGAVFDFKADCRRLPYTMVHMEHIHDLTIDPFDKSLCRCHADELN